MFKNNCKPLSKYSNEYARCVSVYVYRHTYTHKDMFKRLMLEKLYVLSVFYVGR
mgnify:CR=1 FL=1